MPERRPLPESIIRVIDRMVEESGLENVASRELRRDLTDHFAEGLDAGVPVDVLVERFGEPEIAAKLLKELDARPPSTVPDEPRPPWDLFNSLANDVRFAVRVLKKSPTFSLVAADDPDASQKLHGCRVSR